MTNSAFFDAVRSSVFGGSLSQGQVDGLVTIINAWGKLGDGDDRKLAYILSTAFHETARTMQPVRETLAKSDAKAKEILTKSWRAGKLPWVSRDYWSGGFFGRGYVQLTHETNYRKAGQKLGLDLVGNPSIALQPSVAAHILIRGMLEGWFTGKSLDRYISASTADYYNARRVVNGTDRAKMVAQYAEHFEQAIKQSNLTAHPAPQPQKPSPAPNAPQSAPRPSVGIKNAIIAAFIALLLAGLFLILR